MNRNQKTYADVVISTGVESRDRLGNIIRKREIIKNVPINTSPWSANEVSTLGREYTETTRRVTTFYLRPEEAKNVISIIHNDREYDVTGYINLVRWQVLHVKGFRL